MKVVIMIVDKRFSSFVHGERSAKKREITIIGLVYKRMETIIVHVINYFKPQLLSLYS